MEAAAAAEPSSADPYRPRAIGTGDPLDDGTLAAAPVHWPRPGILDAPLTKLRGAGPKLSQAAAEIRVESLGDLLRHLPHSYRDRAAPVALGDLRLGEEATVEVKVVSAGRARPTRRRRLTVLEAKVADDSGGANAVWFNRGWLADRLKPGTRLLLRGKLDKRGFTVSEQEFLDSAGSGGPAGLHTTGLVPVHPASERLRPQKLREWVWQAVPLATAAGEPLPAAVRRSRELAGAADALVTAHFPRGEDETAVARRRLAFEELFLYQAALASRRSRRRGARAARALPAPGELSRDWLKSLPFALTGDQRRAVAEIDSDLGAEAPMQRLLMGEVGSGKTVIAVYAMLRAVEASGQAALMAPTETLAEQHFATITTLAERAGVTVTLLTGATPARERTAALERTAAGDPGIVVGTHALIEPRFEFGSLLVAVVDEQHRFGVRQRAALDAKGPGGLAPHALHMTATPIPRTLSLTAYGDLDVTEVRELPRGRRPVKTWVVGEDKRAGAYEFLRERLREGRQAYVVCPLVSETASTSATNSADEQTASDGRTEARAAEAEGERLARGELREFRVGVTLLTGATPARERTAALERTGAGDPGIVVGTHALIEPRFEFGSLLVAVVDEQHRFGVGQRAALDAKGPGGLAPHALHMTATPIPRTLSLTAYGDLDVTEVRELPRGRRPVSTWVVGEDKRAGAYEFLRERLREGRQAYVVCPLVSESTDPAVGDGRTEARAAAASEAGSPNRMHADSCSPRPTLPRNWWSWARP